MKITKEGPEINWKKRKIGRKSRKTRLWKNHPLNFLFLFSELWCFVTDLAHWRRHVQCILGLTSILRSISAWCYKSPFWKSKRKWWIPSAINTDFILWHLQAYFDPKSLLLKHLAARQQKSWVVSLWPWPLTFVWPGVPKDCWYTPRQNVWSVLVCMV